MLPPSARLRWRRIAAPASPSPRRKARAAQASTTAAEPALIGLDLGAVLGLQLRDRVPGVSPQTSREPLDEVVDAPLAALRPEDDRAVLGRFDLETGAGLPPHPVADGLGDDHLALAGEAGRGAHLTRKVRRNRTGGQASPCLRSARDLSNLTTRTTSRGARISGLPGTSVGRYSAHPLREVRLRARRAYGARR